MWSGLGQLVTDSRFSVANLYSSQVRSTGPKGSLPFLKENHGLGTDQDSNVGQDAHGARAPGYWLLVGLSLFTPHSKGALEWL